MPKIDITLTVTQLERLFHRLDAELAEIRHSATLHYSDRALAEKQVRTQQKALTMALACVRYAAANN